MKKFLEKTYWILLAVYLCILLYVLFTFHINIAGREQKTGFISISDYEVENLEDSGAPGGIRQRYSFTLSESEASFCHLIFYSVHQEIEVSLDGTPVYSLNTDENNSFGRTPGKIWNMIQFKEEDVGKEVWIDFIPVYDSAIDSLPVIYYGDRYDILSSVILRNLPEFFLSAVAILAGVFYMGFVVYAYRKGTGNSNLIMLGTLTILIGTWKLTDMTIFSLFVQGNMVTVYLPLFSLLLVCIPYNTFLRSLHSSEEHWMWNIPNVVCCVGIFLELVLQLLHIADFRESLILTHISIASIVIVLVVMMTREICKNRFDGRLKRNVICICVCITGVVIDMIVYYVSKAQAPLLWGMLGGDIYIFVLGFSAMKEIRKLIAIGREAGKYEEMAYHDVLTGFLNRRAYADDIGREDYRPDETIVVMLDLNNLKACNDNFGHDQGDIYIMTCAGLISECFGDIGKCYRIGGDEFCVLMNGVPLEVCEKRVRMLSRRVAKENEKQKTPVKMEIACGYVIYDKGMDFDIQDTVRRADKMMYKEKYLMKHQEVCRN